jgi:hypothetical protein
MPPPASLLPIRFAALLAPLLLVTAQGIHAQNTTHPKSAPVTVLNTEENPVPVTGSVEVVGSPTDPLLVQDFEPKEVYAASVVSTIGTARFVSLQFDVPEGKRLVIELVTVGAQLPVGRNAAFELVQAVGASVHALSAVNQGVLPESESFLPKQMHRGTHPIQLRVDGGPDDDEIRIRVSTSTEPGDNATNNRASGSISGYLVDL